MFIKAQFRVADVLAAMDDGNALSEFVSPILATASAGQRQAQCLGIYFQRINRRPESGLRLVRRAARGGVATWRIESV